MKTVKISAIAILILVQCLSFGQSKPPQTKEEAKAQINQLLKAYYDNFDNKKYEVCLIQLEEILGLCEKFSFEKKVIIQITDKKDFVLMKAGKFDEALKVAFKLEEMSREIGEEGNPWYCLKIADSYLGMKNNDKAVEWIGKAVHERNFKNYRYLQNSQYEPLQKDSGFLKLITYMKDKIGLQHPAKDFTVKLVDGGEFSLSSLKGKVVLIDFWDVRCTPCVKAIPELKDCYEKFHKAGLEIIGISLDTDKDLLKTFLGEASIPWKIACSYKGYEDDAAKLYGINATPSTWLIDRKGILQYNEVKGEELKAAIEELLKK
jgi:peroxiredoxin